MSMGTIYKATTGLYAFSKGLDVVSNNVANLNTPGYKKNDTLFRDLYYQYQVSGYTDDETSFSKVGSGVITKGSLVDFSQGDIQETGNDTDLAVNGNGFFILRQADATFFTRIGQFQFDEDHFLYSPQLEARVAGLDANNNLVDINIGSLRNLAHEATSRVRFVGNLSTVSASHDIEDVEIVDSLGTKQKLQIGFTRNLVAEHDRSWNIVVEDDEGNIIAKDLEIRFDDNGLPEQGYGSVSFEYTGEKAAAQTIELFFGEAGSRSNATTSGASSNLAADDINGFQTGALLNVNIQSDGTVQLEYSNEEKREAGKIALAWFDQMQSLVQLGDGIFIAPDDLNINIASPTSSVMGEIVDNSIEISNIELSQEFTRLIVLQRGFQGASQTINAANELIQQLIQIGRGK
jgi:flagellar hook protein FlgE